MANRLANSAIFYLEKRLEKYMSLSARTEIKQKIEYLKRLQREADEEEAKLK